MIIPLIQVTASSKAQTITISKQNTSIAAVFEEIMMQTDYDFSYSEQQLSKVGRINISVTNASITDVLDKCFQGQPLTYSIRGKNIIIQTKKTSPIQRLVDTYSNIDIRGIIVDETGLPLVGATVKVKGTTISVSTDSLGRFSIEDAAEDAVLILSFIGYQTKEIPASPNLGTIILNIVSGDLKEIEINAGYYTVKDRERTGSISRITSEQIEKSPVNNVLQALQGQITGMQITQQTGVAGGGFTVQIRGQNSLRNTSTDNGNQPFYVIDGVPYPASNLGTSVGTSIVNQISPLSSISPNDVETIEVLKDADATAIYGSRGANGVILITTKKGKPGKTMVNLNAQSGIGQVAHMMKLLNTEQYLEMRAEAFKNDNTTPGTTAYDLNGAWDKNRYTDWQKELIGGTSYQTNINGSISGGSESTQFLFGGSYYNESSVFPGDFGYNKGNAHFNLNHQNTNKKLLISFTGSYGSDKNSQPFVDPTSEAIRLSPNAPEIYKTDGSLNWQNSTWVNPFGNLRNAYTNRTNNLVANSNVSYEIFQGLKLKTSVGYNNLQIKEFGSQPISAKNPAITTSTGTSRFGSGNNTTWIIEPQIEFQKNFKNGVFNTILGSTFQETQQDKQAIAGTGYTSDALLQNIRSAAGLVVLSNEQTQYRYNAIYGRLNYTFKNRYIVNLTGRRDGSSRFGEGKRIGNFGAVGIAWIFSKEWFFEKIPFISFGKLRSSYGITGNDQIPDYGYLNTYSSTAVYQGATALIPNRIANPDYSWEENKKYQIAVELGMFENRLSFEAEWYRNRSSNQLVGYSLPLITGFPSIQYNLPATVENTGFEFRLDAKILSHSMFRWNSSINFTIPENKLLAYPNIESSSYANTYEVGKSLFQIKRNNFIGVNSNTGIYEFVDRNNNNVGTDIADKEALKKLGQRFYGGFQNSFQFKGLELNVLFQFVKQNGINYPFGGAFSSPPGALTNQLEIVMNRWQNPGDQTSIQKFTQDFSSPTYTAYVTASNPTAGDNAIEDSSFIRVKNVSLAYQIPENWYRKLRFSSLKLYMQAQNLYTITNFRGFDPEMPSATSLPALRVLTMGVQINL